MKVMGRSSIRTVDVRADATGLSSRAGTALLALVAARLGLTGGLSWALASTRERRSGHDPGRVFCDLAVMAADGGRCVSDLAALAGQASLFGDVASISTARRVLLSVGEAELDRIRQARAIPDGWSSTSMRRRSIRTPRRSGRPGITRAGSASTRCWSAAAGRCWLGFCGRGMPVRTTLLITCAYSSSRWSSCLARRLMARSSRGLTRPAQATTSRSRVGKPESGSRLATRSGRRCATRCSRCPKLPGNRRSNPGWLRSEITRA